MGVPKFYRWLSERYSCLSEVVKDSQVPEFDNLYLDMNGIIHTCSHPNDNDVHFRISEEQIFKDIFHYIETLFRIVHPKKVFFMAIDGVAPRAKMNQQRGRRFRSARDAQHLLEAAKKKGEKVSKEDRFDSNCITPGTEFMARLHEQLQFFIQMKITVDEHWRRLRIYFSGHDCPGEGEHKIMDFIRTERSHTDYDPNTRHCLYGLDADLIMLGMCSHEPHFSLLREEVKFLRPEHKDNKRPIDAEQTTFHLLQLSLLREYLNWEFDSIKTKLPFRFDSESLIDDWVLMGFLVGNDFIPHLPNVHIHENALPSLYRTYIRVLPQLNGFINEAGNLHLDRFNTFLRAFAENDKRAFADIIDDQIYIKSKRGQSSPTPANLTPFTDPEMNDNSMEMDPENSDECSDQSPLNDDQKPAFDTSSESSVTSEEETSISSPILNASDALKKGLFGRSAPETSSSMLETPVLDLDQDLDNEESDTPWSDDVNRAFKLHKRDYYRDKLKYRNITRKQLREQAECYVKAIQWNLHYYYHGCCSWNWYYPHHYAPYISDVCGFSDLKISFELSTPFLPFQQLLAVLPASSGGFLPEPFSKLMTEPTSPLIDFYPVDFATDLNGKKNDWEAIVLIPFIDENRLLTAMASREHLQTDSERFRNRHGPHLLFTTADLPSGVLNSTLPTTFPHVPGNLAVRQEVDMDTFRISRHRIVHGLLPSVHVDAFFPGFPTMNNLPHTAALSMAGVKVFQSQSRNASIILTIVQRDEYCNQVGNRQLCMQMPAHGPQSPFELAEKLIGKEVHIDWPMSRSAKIDYLSTARSRFEKSSDGQVKETVLSKVESKNWTGNVNTFKNNQFIRRGIKLGEISVFVHVKRMLGVRFVVGKKRVEARKYWAEDAEGVALQMIMEDIPTCISGPTTLEQSFPLASTLFILAADSRQYGHAVRLKSYDSCDTRGRLVVYCQLTPEPNLMPLVSKRDKFALKWMSGHDLAKNLRMNGYLVSRLTGTIYLVEQKKRNETEQKLNIGLNLKFSKRNEEVPDYTKRDADGNWLYSQNTLQLLNDYRTKGDRNSGLRLPANTLINLSYGRRFRDESDDPTVIDTERRVVSDMGRQTDDWESQTLSRPNTNRRRWQNTALGRTNVDMSLQTRRIEGRRFFQENRPFDQSPPSSILEDLFANSQVANLDHRRPFNPPPMSIDETTTALKNMLNISHSSNRQERPSLPPMALLPTNWIHPANPNLVFPGRFPNESKFQSFVPDHRPGFAMPFSYPPSSIPPPPPPNYCNFRLQNEPFLRHMVPTQVIRNQELSPNVYSRTVVKPFERKKDGESSGKMIEKGDGLEKKEDIASFKKRIPRKSRVIAKFQE